MTRAARAARSADRVEQALEAWESAIGIPRPIEDHGLALHEVPRQSAPEAAVVTVVAVVPHHEELSLRHHVGTEVVARARLTRQDARIFVDGERFLARLAVHEDDLVADLHGLPARGHAALDEVTRRIVG